MVGWIKLYPHYAYMDEIQQGFMDPLVFYSQPGIMTDAGKHASLLAGLPDDLASICLAVQNNMVHVFSAKRLGLNLTEDKKRTLEIRPVAEKLALIAETNDQPLSVPRPLGQRQIGNCRDFTLLLCSILRHKNIPARARCGFGTYFDPDQYVDHWICEYWNAAKKRWMMVDSELDPSAIEFFNIKFDSLDVPPEEFITAGKAWQMCRSGKADPDKFGIFDMHGLRFVWGDVVRDFLALNKVEILPWDGGWGFLNQKLSDPLPDNETLMLYDRIARLTLEINEKFPEIRVYYKSEPRFHIPSEWGLQEE
jgi:hypothetical protein